MAAVRIGTAGWTIPRACADAVRGSGSHLERYGLRFTCTEVNSTFYRPSRASTWVRWAESVAAGFRFAVKAPKAITHDAALAITDETHAALVAFLGQVKLLGAKVGPLLFQLPPKQLFDPDRARTFFEHLRSLYDGSVVTEPRHPSWFSEEAGSLLSNLQISRVAADPAAVPEAALPGGSPTLAYYRLHGSPRKYYSEYGIDCLQRLASELKSAPAETWVIFDNTASGAALSNALTLSELLGQD